MIPGGGIITRQGEEAATYPQAAGAVEARQLSLLSPPPPNDYSLTLLTPSSLCPPLPPPCVQVSFHSMQTPAVLTFLHMLAAAGGLRLASQYDVFERMQVWEEGRASSEGGLAVAGACSLPGSITWLSGFMWEGLGACCLSKCVLERM